MSTVINLILDEMLNETEDLEEQSELLIEYYNEANENQKKAIDYCLICICGYSLDSLLKK